MTKKKLVAMIKKNQPEKPTEPSPWNPSTPQPEIPSPNVPIEEPIPFPEELPLRGPEIDTNPSPPIEIPIAPDEFTEHPTSY